MSAVELFTYEQQNIRTVVIGGEPWFVLSDICRVLGLSNPTMVAERIDPDGLSRTEVTDSLGRTQSAAIVNEAGMYEVVIRSDKPEAVRFRRWVTGEVIPTIRKTGSYSSAPALSEDEIVHQALSITAKRVEALTARVAELEPKAEVADRLLEAEGDLSVRDAAQALTRAGIKTGQNRLFTFLDSLGWVRRAGDGRYRVIQSAIDRGYMSVLPQSHYHPRTGELVVDPPQPRVTPKGLQRLLREFGEVAS